jgi:hypothetical protein
MKFGSGRSTAKTAASRSTFAAMICSFVPCADRRDSLVRRG